MKLYTIYDKVAERSGPVFESINDGIALRQFNRMLQEEKFIEPDDYTLRCIGEFDVEKCNVSVEPNGYRVVTVNSVFEKHNAGKSEVG